MLNSFLYKIKIYLQLSIQNFTLDICTDIRYSVHQIRGLYGLFQLNTYFFQTCFNAQQRMYGN